MTFDLDSNGNLILVGDGSYIDAEAAGLFGENYALSHSTDLSLGLCSPYQCSYKTEFNTSAVHEPYLHQKIKWKEMATEWPEVIHIAEMAGGTIFVGGLTVAGGGIVLETCMTPIACFGGVALMGPLVSIGTQATVYLARGTVNVFKEKFIEITP